jgi:hypothetical protein
VAAALAAMLVCLGASPAGAQTTETAVGEVRGCREIIALVNVPAGPVRERVPSSYTLYEELPGQAMLFVRGASCESVNVSGEDIPTYMAQLGAVIESPDREGCMTHGERDFGFGSLDGDWVKYCSWYPFFMVTDNRVFARWLQADGTQRFPVYHTRAFRYDLRPGLVPGQYGFRFGVAGTAPSPFELEGSGLEREGAIPLRIAYWHTLGEKVVKLFADPDIKIGHAEGEVRTGPDTDLARMLGGTRARFASPFSLNYIVAGPLTKEVRSP